MLERSRDPSRLRRSKSRSFAPAALEKQILRACGAQDDRVARSAKGKREETPLSFFPPLLILPLLPEPRGAVILSDRAARARAKDLLVHLRACGLEADPSRLRRSG